MRASGHTLCRKLSIRCLSTDVRIQLTSSRFAELVRIEVAERGECLLQTNVSAVMKRSARTTYDHSYPTRDADIQLASPNCVGSYEKNVCAW